MTRISLAVYGTTLALASTTLLAQSGPDFSPMEPPGTQSQSQAQSPSAAAYPNNEPPAATNADNRMLNAYESSNTPRGELPAPALAPYEPAVAERDVAPGRRLAGQPIPRQSVIGSGLFNRRGPDDFGA